MKRKAILPIVAVVAGLLAGLLVVTRDPVRRRIGIPQPERVVEVTPIGNLVSLPAEEWSDAIRALQHGAAWRELDLQLGALAARRPGDYARFRLGYLHARVKGEVGEPGDAAELMLPFASEESDLRDLALYHAAAFFAESGAEERAADLRGRLIFEETDGVHRGLATEEHLDHLAEEGGPAQLLAFIERLYPDADENLRRTLDVRRVAALLDTGNVSEGVALGIRLLDASTADDAAEQLFRLLDRREIVSALPAETVALLGDAASRHRHYDRAVDLLTQARAQLPARRDDLTFAIGRAHFGAERYDQAQRFYLAGAAQTRDNGKRARFYFHASRTAQLLGDDRAGEIYLTRAIAVPGRFEATSAALTQRLRTRVAQRRFDEARRDLALLRKYFARDRGMVEGTLGMATALIAAGRNREAIAVIDALPAAATNAYDEAELAYWKARALEQQAPAKALRLYLQVLRAEVPTHFAYFARARLRLPHLRDTAAREAAALRQRAAAQLDNGAVEEALRTQTDAVLLETTPEALGLLRAIYARVPEFDRVASLTPAAFPELPDAASASRGELLAALGLFDDAVEAIPEMYPAATDQGALTQALAFNRAGASRDSIRAAEILLGRVPDVYLPELLPPLVKELLYPRYYYEAIVADAERYGADARLLLSIMREESRFNPRAKSFAAARGLLQFIISTALDVGRSLGIFELTAEDLYDPRTVIRLGAKYVADLGERFEGNRYQIAASYNAGPNQAELWRRLAPADADDFFLSSVNFDETKHYVRKVMNSYARYGEIYGEAALPVGGLQIEP